MNVTIILQCFIHFWRNITIFHGKTHYKWQFSIAFYMFSIEVNHRQELCFSGCKFLSDETLQRIIGRAPHLQLLDLTRCPKASPDPQTGEKWRICGKSMENPWGKSPRTGGFHEKIHGKSMKSMSGR